MTRMISILLVLIALSACGQRTCSADDPAFTATLIGLVETWQQTTTAAEVASPNALGPHIAALHDLHAQVDAVTAPECGRTAQSALLVAITATTDELTARAEQQAPDQLKAKHAAVVLATRRLDTELKDLRIHPTTIANPIPPLHSNVDTQ